MTLPHSLFDPARFSNWNRLLRAVAYVLKSLKLFKKQMSSCVLTGEELFRAENCLWRQAQLESYADEYVMLNKQTSSEAFNLPKSSALYQLNPFIDNHGVIRMNSRIEAAPAASFETKFPIILPASHRITFLLIDSYHRRFLHQNNETVLNELRQKFSIPRLRSMIKKVANRCQHCRVYKAKPIPPQMASLPSERLTPFIGPFTHTGIDYFGPILVKQGRSLVKRWVCLFTCLTITLWRLSM